MQGIESELFVVDNNSVDGSCQMIRRLFPSIILLENNTNVGFAKANNQAIVKARGEYILLLNPDTVVEKESFQVCIEYMDKHSNTGGLGVKMIDGNGTYLPESKRGFPSPEVAFYKLSGLAKLFPKSKRFNKYHLGYLDNDSIHEVDVLSGAYMFLRKSVLDEIGILDESYFMYGEDIDLSYRIINAGFKNIYFPKTTIIHYKGQSTQKGSLNYVVLFYTAMKLFSQKFFTKTHARTFIIFINIAIYFRAALSLIRRIIAKLLYPILDFLILYSGFALFSPYWAQFKYHNSQYDFPSFYYHVNIPVYAFILVSTLYITQSYIRPIEIGKTFKNIALAMLINLAIFALLPETLRFSRAMFIIATIWSFLLIPISRYILHVIDKQDFRIKSKHKRRTIIIGDEQECMRVTKMIAESTKNENIVGYVSPEPTPNDFFIGSLKQIKTIIKIHKIEDVLFCEQDISENVIINAMIDISTKNLECKIAPKHARFIIGNTITNTTSELYTITINSIALGRNKIIKRLFDILFACIIMVLSPILFFYFLNKTMQLLKNSKQVLKAEKTWIGFNSFEENEDLKLPEIKRGIISIVDNAKERSENRQRLNILYAKNYSIMTDLRIVFKQFNNLCL
jgi:GT2 family glycosyltransferase